MWIKKNVVLCLPVFVSCELSSYALLLLLSLPLRLLQLRLSFADFRIEFLWASNTTWNTSSSPGSSRSLVPDWQCWGIQPCGVSSCRVPSFYRVWTAFVDLFWLYCGSQSTEPPLYCTFILQVLPHWRTLTVSYCDMVKYEFNFHLFPDTEHLKPMALGD